MKHELEKDHCSSRPSIPPMLPVVSVELGPPRGISREIRAASSDWTWRDRVGHWKVRWGIGRKSYRVEPGLYRLGAPGPESPVLVSANYKLSFDVLRRALAARDAWILVLDSAGINVWCAAGKGTFGTEELLRLISMSRLKEVVSARKLVVPQLGAPGIAAHEVKERSGFKVIFGPVRAEDLPAFLDAGLKADRNMRLVTFTFKERLVLVPMELVPALKWSLPVLLLLWILGGWGWWGYSQQALRANGLNLTLALAGGIFSGAVAAPLLLPWLPGRAFSLKGAFTGLAWSIFFLFFLRGGAPGIFPSPVWEGAVWILALPALSAFLSLNFTGSSTLTSFSGVKKEFRLAIPIQVAAGTLGLALWIAGHFFRGGA